MKVSGNPAEAIVVGLLVLVFAAIYGWADGWIAMLIVFGPVFLLLLRNWTAVCRTFVFDAEGITVRLWFYSRRIRWEDLKTVRAERYRIQNWYLYETEAYSGWMEFSPKTIRRPRWMLPETYSAGLHPMNYIFVHFPSDKFEAMYQRRFIPHYVVDEEEFLAKLEEWGVKPERI